jgi:hypothetical protein
MSTQPHQYPFQKLAPHTLPYTRARVTNGKLEIQFDRDAYARDLQLMSSLDLLDKLEHLRLLAVEYADHPSDSRKVAEMKIRKLLAECARRQRLIATGDELAPRWPSKRPDLTERIAAVKAALPIDRLAAEAFGVILQRTSNSQKVKGLCPIHEEKTPSFYLDLQKNSFHCFGCGAGGDVLDLAGIKWEMDRTIDQLQMLERFAGIEAAR